MIKSGEIQQKARKSGVRDQQIEKDYVLSWILYGISNHDQLSRVLAFKGGTVLKKVYFENYRFSEDLDFTLLDESVTDEQVFSWFAEVFKQVREDSNIPLELLDSNKHEDGSFNFYIGFLGPLGGQGSNKKIKTDISRTEKLAFPAVLMPVLIGYSDLQKHHVLCYSLEEVLVEKLRSVMQRMQARDFFDLWFLLEQQNMDIELYAKEFALKCNAKGLNPADLHKKLSDRRPQYKARWNKSLSDQIKDLPDFGKVEREIQRHIRNLKL
jgi:uncharacterized protein